MTTYLGIDHGKIGAIRLILPFPPSVNHYWRTFRGIHCISKKGKEYRAEVCRRLRGIATITGPIALEIIAHRPDRRIRDLDNLLKSPLDALTHAGAYEDDSQIHRLCIRWAQAAEDAVPGGALVVRIEKMQESQ